MPADFTWRDGERTIRFGDGVADESPDLLTGAGFDRYVLLTTERAARAVPRLGDSAERVVHVPAGKVDEVSAALLGDAGGLPLVALGGGRVVDSAKAIAGVGGQRCAALPTTLSGAEMTPFHRTPAGIEGGRMVRPVLVVADPELMASQPPTQLAGSAMNALAHATESLYTPMTNPVAEMAALRAAELIARGLPAEPPDRPDLALAGVLAGYSSGLAGIAVHHAVCQSIVRTCGTPHAETNAVMLPHFCRFMAARAPGAMGALAEALGDGLAGPEETAGRVAKLAARCGHTRLSTLGVEQEQLAAVADMASRHPAMGNTPDPPGPEELLGVLEAAL